MWALFSADEELGYVYMPVTSPTSDMYGGHRLGNNLFGQSLVCVKADTGERVWHFQLTHTISGTSIRRPLRFWWISESMAVRSKRSFR